VTPVDKNNEPLDAILRGALRQRTGPATPECADAESLAAYSDKSLATPERERLETHFADCMRCQVLLADIARAEGRDPNSASEIPWYRRWIVAIPALAAVAAVAVFVSIRHFANDESQRDQPVAIAKNEAPATAADATKPLAPAAPAAAPVPGPATAPASNELAMTDASREMAPRAQAINAAVPRTTAKSAAAPPAPEAMAAAQTGAAPAAGAAIGAITALNSSSTSMKASLVTISPPDGSVAWIVGRNGMIRRRDANGETQQQQSGVSTDLIAGAAPSATVCWIVGRSGTVVRTIDGKHWTPVIAPTTENLTAVSASSANDATITNVGGQSFATSDGGASWHPQ
jgi:hypothetical protein